MAFQMASLETSISALPESKNVNMKRIISDPEKFKLICKKGEFLYEWFDTYEKFVESVPDRQIFYNNMTQSNMGDETYDNMIKTIDAFKIQNLEEFHDLYLDRDVYGLADVMETFRELSMETYGLDPCFYVGTP
eukprot:gene32815-41805_t